MKSVLITRPRAQAEDFAAGLKAAGFEPVFFPVIEIRPLVDNTDLERALKGIAAYDWLIFTSSNAVNVLWNHPNFQAIPGHVQVAAVGPKTAEALLKHDVKLAFVPRKYVAEAILPGLGDLRGRRVLLPCADIARQDLHRAIVEAGGTVDEIVVYQTLPTEPDPAGLARLKAGVSVVVLTSPSTVENFIAIARQNGLDPLALPGQPVYACIGPVTLQVAREARLPGVIMAEEYTTVGLIKIIKSLL